MICVDRHHLNLVIELLPETRTFRVIGRAELIEYLTRRVEEQMRRGAPSPRHAIRKVSAETGLTPLSITRLVELYPEA